MRLAPRPRLDVASVLRPDSRHFSTSPLALESMIRCPRCTGPLAETFPALSCAACDATFSTRDGVIDLSATFAATGGLQPGDRPLLLEDNSLDRALRDACRESAPGNACREAHAFEGTEYAWKVFVAAAPGLRVLDLGCGFGARALSLARHGCAVTAVAAARRTAMFTAARLASASASAKVPHRVLVLAGLARLPLSDRSVDLVLLPLDLACDRGDWKAPCRIDAMMAEVDRVLTPDGVAMLMGANRWAAHRIARRFRGWITGRTPPTARPGARTSASAGAASTHDAELLGLGGYQRSLRNAGLRGAASWILVRDASGDLVGLRDAMTRVHAPGARVSLKMRIKRSVAFAPEFAILATRGERRQASLIERALDAVAQSLPATPHAGGVRVAGYYVSRKDKLVADLRTSGGSLIMRLCLSPAARAAEERAASMLRSLATAYPDASWFPRVLSAGEIDGLFCSAEQKLDGQSLLMLRSTLDESQLLQAAQGVLRHTNPDANVLRDVALDGDLWHELVTARIEKLSQFSEFADRLASLKQWLDVRLRGLNVRIGVVHGDVSLNNVFVRDSGDHALIDWENSTTRALPIFDGIAFLRSVHTQRHPRDDDGTGRARLAFSPLSDVEETFLRAQYERFGLARTYHAPLVYLQWLHAITCNLDFAFMQSAANIDRHIDAVLRAIPDEMPRT